MDDEEIIIPDEEADEVDPEVEPDEPTPDPADEGSIDEESETDPLIPEDIDYEEDDTAIDDEVYEDTSDVPESQTETEYPWDEAIDDIVIEGGGEDLTPEEWELLKAEALEELAAVVSYWDLRGIGLKGNNTVLTIENITSYQKEANA